MGRRQHLGLDGPLSTRRGRGLFAACLGAGLALGAGLVLDTLLSAQATELESTPAVVTDASTKEDRSAGPDAARCAELGRVPDRADGALDGALDDVIACLLQVDDEATHHLLRLGRRLAENDSFARARIDHVESLLLARRGVTDEAFELSQRSREVFLAAARGGTPDAVAWLSSAEHNAGVLLMNQGRLDEARESLHTALRLRERFGKAREVAATQMQIGWLHHLRGDLDRALETLESSYALRTEPPGRAASLDRLASVHAAAGHHETARAMFGDAMAIYRDLGGSKDALRGHVLANLGWLWLERAPEADPELARGHLLDALPLLEALGDDDAVSHALTGLARAERALGRPDEALEFLEAAIDRLEGLRGHIDRRAQRSSFLTVEARQRPYLDRVDLLAERAQTDRSAIERALSASEQGRSRMLLELLLPTRTAGDDAATRRLAAIGDEIAQLRTRTARSRLDDPRATRERLATLSTAYERLRDSLSMPASTLDPREMVNVDTVRGLIDDDTTVLLFAVGDARSFLFVVDAERLELFTLSARDELRRRAERTHRLLAGRGARDVARARTEVDELSALLFHALESPSAPALRRRLVVVKDGALHRLPMGVLEVGDEPLIEHHEIVAVPSLGVLLKLRARRGQTAANDDLLVVVAPDATTADGTTRARREEDLPRLAAVDTEVASLRALVPERRLRVVAGSAAGRELFLGGGLAALGRVRVLHISSHAVIGHRFPELSALVLAGPDGDETLQLQEIFGLSLPAEMVVLSACETALGDLLPGEGMIGMTHGFLSAGAQRVVVSHWPVDDEATAALMSRFYRQLFGVGLDAPAALRNAKLALRDEPHGRWEAPYFWAPFEIQGDWL